MFFIFFMILSFNIFAENEITAMISSVDYPIPPEKETLIFLDSGLVLKSSHDQKFFQRSLVNPNIVRAYHFIYNEHREIVDVKTLKQIKNYQEPFFMMNEDYIPTTISSLTLARRYFREARYYEKESQCFNRAMVWSYEWWRRHSLRSNKILIFFTRNYIRRYNFEWWFHIAPLVNVFDENMVKERVMDIKYSSGPLPLKNWTDLFMKGDPECPIVDRYSDYADHPYEGDCYLQRTHMYTYQPADLQMYEAWGYQKTDFSLKEVQQAYREAMDEIVTIEEEESGHETP